MVRQTSYHEWEVPEEGDENYAETFDEWWDDLDLDVSQTGSAGDRPSAGTQGRVFIDTSGPTIYFDDGNSWNVVAGVDVDEEDIVGLTDLYTNPGNRLDIHSADNRGIKLRSDTYVDFHDEEHDQIIARADIDSDNSDDTEFSVRTDLNVRGDIYSGPSVIWDDDGSHIPSDRLEDEVMLEGDEVGLLSASDAETSGHVLHTDGDGGLFWDEVDGGNGAEEVAVEEDGIQITDAVEVLNFSNRLDITEPVDDEVDIDVDTDDLANVTNSETVTANWTFDGDVSVNGELDEGGDRVVVTDEEDGYEIQVDGTDGEGIINFKTEGS